MDRPGATPGTGAGLGTAATTLVAPVAWGTTYVTVTELLPGWGSLWVPVARVLPAAAALVAVTTMRTRWRPRGVAWWHVTALGLANFGVFFPLLILAVYRMPGGVAAAFAGVQPILVVLLSWLVFGRQPQRVELAIGAVAAFGVSLVVIRPGASIDPVGVIAALGAYVSFSSGVVLTKRFPIEPAYRIAATGWQCAISTAILLPLALAVDGLPPRPDVQAVLGIAHLAFVGTALAFVLWFRGIGRLPTFAPPLLALATPITGVIMGWLVRDETMTAVQLTGFVLVLGAIAYGAALSARTPMMQPAPSAGTAGVSPA